MGGGMKRERERDMVEMYAEQVGETHNLFAMEGQIQILTDKPHIFICVSIWFLIVFYPVYRRNSRPVREEEKKCCNIQNGVKETVKVSKLLWKMRKSEKNS